MTSCVNVFELKLLNLVLLYCILFELEERVTRKLFYSRLDDEKPRGSSGYFSFCEQRNTSCCTKYKEQYHLAIVTAIRCLIMFWEFDCLWISRGSESRVPSLTFRQKVD